MSNESVQSTKRGTEEKTEPDGQEIEHQPEIICRICLEDQEDTELISLCKCTGSIEFVHEKCIKSWILVREKDIDNAECEICHTKILMTYHMSSELAVAHMCKEGQKSLAFAIALVFVLLILTGIIGFLSYRLSSSSEFEDANNIILIGLSSVGILFLVFVIIRSLIKAATKTDIADWKILPQYFPDVNASEVSQETNRLPAVDISSLCVPNTVSFRGKTIQTSMLMEMDSFTVDHSRQDRRLNYSLQYEYQSEKYTKHSRTSSK